MSRARRPSLSPRTYRFLRPPSDLTALIVALGVALATGITVARLVTPHWRAAGLPYLLGFGKNVEALAVAAALLAGAASRAFAGSRYGRYLGGALATAGYLLLVLHGNGSRLLVMAPRLLFAALVVGSLGAIATIATSASNRTSADPLELPRLVDPARRPSRGADRIPRWGVVAGLVGLSAFEFLIALEALSIDVFHHGEVLASAVDLVGGGHPFESFIWPHGLHDSGLAALFLALTDKVGTSPVALARSACAALGVVSTFVLGRSLGLLRSQALAIAALLVTLPFGFGSTQGNVLPALSTLGILLFVVLGFAALGSRYAGATLLAGALFAFAHLFRFETGIFAAVAAAVALFDRHLPTGWADVRGRLRSLVVDGGALLAGFVGTLILCRVVVGWPGRAWFDYIFLELARHHRDAVGVVLSWPARGTASAQGGEALTSEVLAWLLLVLGLLVAAVGAALRRPRCAPHRDASDGLLREPFGPRESPLTFFSVFALLATRSALDRVDTQHVSQWAALPALAILLLAARSAGERRRWGTMRIAAAVGLVLIFIDIRRPAPVWPAPRSPAEIARRIRDQVRLLGEHLASNPALGDCDDTSFTRIEADLPKNRLFLAATCEVERLLAHHGVTNLAIAHSAPWYWVRFGMRPPTRYFALARAYAPVRQLELVGNLRESESQALLRPRGFGGMLNFDLADAVRVPVVDAFLRARRAGARAVVTPIGEIFFWNEPASSALEPGAESPAERVQLKTELLTYQAASGLFFARGTARDTLNQGPVAGLELDRPGQPPVEIESGLLRAASRDFPGAAPQPPVGWELSLQVPEMEATEILRRGALPLRAYLTDGSVVPLALDLTPIRRLGPLIGDDWQDLRAAVTTATELGHGDRRRALELRGETRQPRAKPPE